MSADSAPAVDHRSKTRSRISNGTALLPGIDGRSTWVRRLRDLMALHLADMGGVDNVSEAEKSIIRRIACLTVELERIELDFATADEQLPAKLDQYQRCANTLRRLLEAVGLKRVPRDVTPTLDDIAAEIEASREV